MAISPKSRPHFFQNLPSHLLKLIRPFLVTVGPKRTIATQNADTDQALLDILLLMLNISL